MKTLFDLLSPAAKLCLCALLLAARGDLAAQGTAPDREYTLVSTMLGYRGVGGDIEGLRDPTLWAKIGAASFLSDDEKREAVGYGVRGK